MPSSVHKLLAHGWQIIQKFEPMPIYLTREEAGESTNKEIKKIRKQHARRTSAKASMEDVMTARLVASDPIVASVVFKKRSNKKKEPIEQELLNLMKLPSDKPSAHINSEAPTELEEFDKDSSDDEDAEEEDEELDESEEYCEDVEDDEFC
eukprot:Pompholyxophrys_punicea_v1_NODE_841_length_1223_cov_28.606164.p1 type:complete len:151 gc:universal NODE_841_length_1223_cov_28.606164:1081-629(-)